ncbi:hypothetical protein VNO78_11395 [Psophocarpus tetragonolobus]|uniref:Uncharacterized protein n=1 Tax=Psophocarpus tetragonolobus TaxID=3891 RepID=A0AAN9XNM8_PSOTE
MSNRESSTFHPGHISSLIRLQVVATTTPTPTPVSIIQTKTLTILKGEIFFEDCIIHAMGLKLKVEALFLVVLLLLVWQPSCGVAEDWSTSTRRLSRHNNPIPNCGHLLLKSQCSENSKCSWCTSHDLDHMCFSKSEALRLPPQVFSCAFIP